ncbi:FAD-dependent monooxygenase [uncultured Sphingomonas sp.]|uniref:NAD(P)/FAD-dependent oxidoreductase n=1 Tax=uncultured Sphingomonas sp. TaxID=158754 RepID=UPI0025E6B604|nr:FAD-dependent monooxygenase [uncultured Sphingomonas sp.]
MRRPPALILGGGPAGAAAAIALAQHGIRATMLERAREMPDALCGGFLSWQTLAAVERLGIAPEALNPNVITRVRMCVGDRVAEAPLPAPARAVSRARLDTLLLERAQGLGVGIERGVTVRALEGRSVRLGDGAELTGDALLLATGKHDLRGSLRDAMPDADPILGIRVRLPASPAIGDAVELHLVDGGYIGVAVQEDGSANICMAIARSRLQAAGDPLALLRALATESPMLADRFDRLDPSARIDAVANVPYGWRTATTVDEVFRLGDQAAVIPSLAGEGIGLALASGVMAADAVAAGRAAADYQAAFARRAARPLAAAGLIRHAADSAAGARLLLAATPILGLARLAARLTRITHPSH